MSAPNRANYNECDKLLELEICGKPKSGINPEPEKVDLNAFETKYEVRNGMMRYIGPDDENYPKKPHNLGSGKKRQREPSTSESDNIAPKFQKLTDNEKMKTISPRDDDTKQVASNEVNKVEPSPVPQTIPSVDPVITHTSVVDSGARSFVRPWESCNDTQTETCGTPFRLAGDFQEPESRFKSPSETDIPSCKRNEWDFVGFGSMKYACNQTGFRKGLNEFQNSIQLDPNDLRGGFVNPYRQCAPWTRDTSLQEKTDLNVPDGFWDVSRYSQRNGPGDYKNVNSRSNAYTKGKSPQNNTIEWEYKCMRGGDNFHQSFVQNYNHKDLTQSKGFRPRGKRGGKNRHYNKNYKEDGKLNENDETDVVNMSKFVSAMMNAYNKK